MTGARHDVLSTATERFLSAEAPDLAVLSPLSPGHTVRGAVLAGIGTTAPRALAGDLLAAALSRAGWRADRATAYDGPAQLLADPTWHLAIVLSPWKLDVATGCARLSPSAEATGVVDTVLRTVEGVVGFNTNTWAAQTALEVLAGGRPPGAVLLVGSGASARSVALAVKRVWPHCSLHVAARSEKRAALLAEHYGGRVMTDPPARGEASLVINATTWGETDLSETEPLAVDLTDAFGPGVALFDLNNRIGRLAYQALAAGCIVASGSMMQQATNASRAALLDYAQQP